ncbi:MAG: hypothetical protein ABIR70_19815 [Bryobacteraceae bacterium]
MRAYSAANEEALQARALLKDWAGEGFLSKAQYDQMQQETVCDLRRTNIFLRVVMFFFTVIIVGAVVGLFFAGSGSGGVLILFAGIAYFAAEVAASKGFYRYGFEEAFLVCSVGLLCVGVESLMRGEFLVGAIGAIASLWIWHRFGLAYAFFGAMIFSFWFASHAAPGRDSQHWMVAGVYLVGLMTVASVRVRYSLTFLNERFSIAEAMLWLGVYVALNLELGSWLGYSSGPAGVSRVLFWTSWVLIWCIPPVVLFRGLKQKDRFVIWVGGLTVILTLATNKSYLGWERHTWDPMLLGALLVGVALCLQRWLGKGVRNGYTAQRLSGQDKAWMSIVSAAAGVASQHAPQHSTGSETHFGDGGTSGGAGASSDF